MIADKHAPKRLSLNRGLRVWGERGMSSVKGELSQIHHRNIFRPADPTSFDMDTEKGSFGIPHILRRKKKS